MVHRDITHSKRGPREMREVIFGFPSSARLQQCESRIQRKRLCRIRDLFSAILGKNVYRRVIDDNSCKVVCDHQTSGRRTGQTITVEIRQPELQLGICA
jgi:hypothetical protein